jgi:phosphatidylethanolamine/phosphatidyl-N-methylethanolamine N-methyltransferase
LIKAGVDPARIYVIELDPELAKYLKTAMPQVNIIQGDAADLANILPSHILGKINRIVSGLPMINMPQAIRDRILESCFQVMAPGGAYLQYTYSPRSSINANAYQLNKKRLGTVFLNLPPATVWEYTKRLAS